MDIAALSILLNQAQVKQQASLSVAKMVMDTGETQMDGMLKMLGESANLPEVQHPYLGGKIDIQA